MKHLFLLLFTSTMLYSAELPMEEVNTKKNLIFRLVHFFKTEIHQTYFAQNIASATLILVQLGYKESHSKTIFS